MHIIQLEPQVLGVKASKQVCGMAYAHNALTAPHSAQGPVCSVVCAHPNAATPNFYIHEIFDEFNEPWEESYISPPDDPGLGVELDLAELSRHPYRRENWLPLFEQDWERREGGE